MASKQQSMTYTDYIGFASMTLLVIGAVNWGTVAIRYAAGSLPMINTTELEMLADGNATVHKIYELVPTPDLLDLVGVGPDVQMFVYWAVFGAGIAYLVLFVWNSIEVRTAESA